MDRSELLGLMATLGREFVRLHLDGHASDLRATYRSIHSGAPLSSDFENWVLDWLGLLGLPPCENRFQHLSVRSRCPKCGLAGREGCGVRSVSFFPLTPTGPGADTLWAWLMVCGGCGERWVGEPREPRPVSPAAAEQSLAPHGP